MIYAICHLVAKLYVAIAWLRACGLNAHGEHVVVGCHKTQGSLYILLKLVLVDDGLVGWRHHDASIGVDVVYAVCTPCRKEDSSANIRRLINEIQLKNGNEFV